MRPFFAGSGAVLMRPHKRRVNQRVFIIGIGAQGLEYPFPYAALRPARPARGHSFPWAKPFRSVTPWHPCPVTVQYRFYTEPMVFCRSSDMMLAAGKHVLDAIPLVVASCIAASHANTSVDTISYYQYLKLFLIEDMP